MPKFHDQGKGNYAYRCPGCGCAHSVSTIKETARQMPDGSTPCWKFNGDMEMPTLEPSVNYTDYCHHYVENGNIRFLHDCQHHLKNQTVPLPDWTQEASESER